MARLIDADALKKHYAWWEDDKKKLFDSIVDQQPTVETDMSEYSDRLYKLAYERGKADAVPVIRCKDCKWYKTNYSWDGQEYRVCVIDAYEPVRKADDFCSRAERKEE